MPESTTARTEIIERLKSRDLSLTVFSTGFATLAAVAFSGTGSVRILLSVPFLALTFALLAAYHDSVVSYLHRFVKNVDSESWDNSPELSSHHGSPMRWAYVAAQLLAFVGGSVLALFLNWHIPEGHIEYLSEGQLSLLLTLGAVATLLTFVLTVLTKLWRLDEGVRSMRVRVIVVKTDNGFAASTPDVPNCKAVGTTPKEVEARIRSRIKEHLKEQLAAGYALPPSDAYSTILEVSA